MNRRRQAVSRQATDRSSGRPIQYRLPKPTVEAIEKEKVAVVETIDEDYTPLVRGVLRAASTLFLGQALSAIFISNFRGAELQIKFLWKFLPNVAILTDRASFVKIVTWSTSFACVITCAAVLAGLVRHRKERQLLDGWAMGLLMSGLLLLFQYVRHVLHPPVIDGWILAQTTAGVIAATVVFLGFRPGAPISASAERSTDRTRPHRSGASTPQSRNTTKEYSS